MDWIDSASDLLEFYRDLLSTDASARFVLNGMILAILGCVSGWIAWKEIDGEEIPDNAIYALALFGLAVPSFFAPPFWPGLQDVVMGLALSGLMFLWVRLGMIYFKGFSTLGFSEVKFAAMAGVWAGWDGMPVFMILSLAFGALVFGVVAALRRLRGDDAGLVFPFSPALGLGLVSTVLLRAWLGI